MINELKSEFDRIANKYAIELSATYFPDSNFYYWIGNDIGSVIEINDYFIGFNEIRYIVDNKIAFDEFDAWYDYSVTLKSIGDDIQTPTLKSWHEGCPRKTKSEIEKLKQLKKKVEEAKETLRIEIENFKRD